MRRYWVNEEQFSGEDSLWIEGEQYQHIVRVCRQGLGARFEVLSKSSKAYLVEIVELQKSRARAQVIEERKIAPLSKPHIHLAVSLPKFQKTDEIIEKSVELGVHSVHPFVSDYSFIRTVDKIGENKFKRWERIVISATQQCGRGELMSVQPVKEFSEILEKFNQNTTARGLFFYEGESQRGLSDALKELKNESYDEIWLFVGSEGGFSNAEVERFQALNLAPVTLGAQILRVETACTSVVSIIKYELVN